jgi:hypothetical protein
VAEILEDGWMAVMSCVLGLVMMGRDTGRFIEGAGAHGVGVLHGR